MTLNRKDDDTKKSSYSFFGTFAMIGLGLVLKRIFFRLTIALTWYSVPGVSSVSMASSSYKYDKVIAETEETCIVS